MDTSWDSDEGSINIFPSSVATIGSVASPLRPVPVATSTPSTNKGASDRPRRPSTVISNFSISLPYSDSDSEEEEGDKRDKRVKGQKVACGRDESSEPGVWVEEEEDPSSDTWNSSRRLIELEGDDEEVGETPRGPRENVTDTSSSDRPLLPKRRCTRVEVTAETESDIHRESVWEGQEENAEAVVSDIEQDFRRRTQPSSARSSYVRRQRLRYEAREVESTDGLTDVVMTIIWTRGRIGIAYYVLETAEMFVLPDTPESAPDFYVVRSMFRQISPRFLIVSAIQDDRLLKVCCQLCGENFEEDDENENVEEREARSSAPQLITVHSRLFSPDACKKRLMSLKLPFSPKDANDKDLELFICSLLPLRGNDNMVRAAGALLTYLDKRARELFQIELMNGHLPVINAKPCTMDDIVMVDDTAWQSLQIFSLDLHPASNKQGNNPGSKEGLSVFGLLSQACSTGQGVRALRLMLLRPSRNMQVLERRHSVVDYCMNSRNSEFITSAKSCLKAIKNLPRLLYKLTLLNATVVEWKDLYQSLYHLSLLGELCSGQDRTLTLFQDLSEPESVQILRELSSEMLRVIEFDESTASGRIVVRKGVDADIDRKKNQYACLPDIMSAVASEEMRDLPEVIERCSIIYIPEVGYLLSIEKDENLNHELLEFPEEFEFKFDTSDCFCYKTPRTRELDIILGDCSVAILEMETSLMIYLAENILKYSTLIINFGSLAAELDCLFAMTAIATSGKYVRPEIVSSNENLKITKGRHPLVEELCDFVPNNTKLYGLERVVIVTGPNASGKSIYLKQIGIIVIMALSGSFVPAISAKIPAFDKVYTRIHATESVSSGFSSFMMDLSQMSSALRLTSNQSLVIIDEFGKGTAEVDGLSLLVASVQSFLERRDNSPIVFLSTHFFSIVNYLERSPLLKMQSMKFVEHRDEMNNSGITYLHELVDGRCSSSLARIVAQQVGIPRHLTERYLEIEDVINNQTSESTLVPVTTSNKVTEQAFLMDVGRSFVSLSNVEEVNSKEFLAYIRELCEPNNVLLSQ